MRRRFNVDVGFSLPELLVVVAMIVILASLLLTVVSRARGHAQRTACLNNLKQINLAVHMYADEHDNTLPGRLSASADTPSTWVAFIDLIRGYVGLAGAPSPHQKLFACPADTFFYDYKDRVSQSLHRQSLHNYTSYAFNAGNLPRGDPPVHPWPGVAGWNRNSINDPIKTVLVAEFPALLPYSWHRPVRESHYNNAQAMVSFVDGHVRYIKMYWDATNVRIGHEEAWHYDPPADYDYKWSGE